MESDVIMPMCEVLKEMKSQNINLYIIKQKTFFKGVIIVGFYVIMRNESMIDACRGTLLKISDM